MILGPGATLAEILRSAGLYLSAPSIEFGTDVLTSDLRLVNNQTAPLKWEQGTYQLAELMVLRPLKSTAGTSGAPAIRRLP